MADTLTPDGALVLPDMGRSCLIIPHVRDGTWAIVVLKASPDTYWIGGYPSERAARAEAEAWGLRIVRLVVSA